MAHSILYLDTQLAERLLAFTPSKRLRDAIAYARSTGANELVFDQVKDKVDVYQDDSLEVYLTSFPSTKPIRKRKRTCKGSSVDIDSNPAHK